jgi:light-regulated signal transduction histidine kinase (bacteriophytochrome)
MLFDITERKENEERFNALYGELEQRVRELNRANEELRMLNYSISHDLRAPSIAVEAFSRKLLDKYSGNMEPKGRKLISMINRSAAQMRELTEGLLSFFSAGRKVFRPSLVDMDGLAREAVEQLRAAFGDRAMEFSLLPLLPAKGDRVMLRQVLLNILQNAVKYARPGEQAAVEVGCTSQPGSTVYHVSDNGIGFSMDEADRLFNVFERLHSADDYEGRGIGLAIVKRIVERHGGKVWAESAPGEGSTFYFSIPSEQQSVTTG